MDAKLEYDPAKPSTLGNSIHELFSEDLWDGIDARQYDSMKPGLKLATLFISEPQLHYYWYALLLGPRKTVGEAVLHADGSWGKTKFFFSLLSWPIQPRTNSYGSNDPRYSYSFLPTRTHNMIPLSWDCGTGSSVTRRVFARLPLLPELSPSGSASDVYIHVGHWGLSLILNLAILKASHWVYICRDADSWGCSCL